MALSEPAEATGDAAPAIPRAQDHAADLGGRHRYINRHLSWLDFDTRVLELAEDTSRVLLERAKFLAISSSNLDEFFQVRVGGLIEQRRAGVAALSPDGMTVDEQLSEIQRRAIDLTARQMRAFRAIVEGLGEVGLRFSNYDSLDRGDRQHVDGVFEERIFPVLTPLAVDPAHPFPYISDLSLNLAVVVGAPRGSEQRIARVKVPPLLPRFVVMPDGERFVPVEQVIAAHLDRLFPGMRVVGQYPFRVTRNADPALEEEEAEDLRTAVQEYLRRRRRSPQVVRLEIDDTMTEEVTQLLMRELELAGEDVYTVAGPLDLSGLWGLYELSRPDLKERLPAPVIPPALAKPANDEGEVDIFRVIDEGDILVHHPYESFASSVEAFVDQAVSDPDVLAIKQTLYRTSGPDSPIVRSLIRAAESGKQVVALVELTARFDEEANITWAAELEKAGVHVVYGVVGLKTHAKATLVVRREGSTIRRYCHIGTGNYNSKTARLYEDIGLLTADPDIGADLTDLFNTLTGYSRKLAYRNLLVAPHGIRVGIIERINREIAAHQETGNGHIRLKMNSLVDEQVLDALYRASQAGVRVEIVVRGICALRPGVEGFSENITVRSILGQYLEHSRIFNFRAINEFWIGSADMMHRNLDRRVEVLVQVKDPRLTAQLNDIFESTLDPATRCWELGPDGQWTAMPRAGHTVRDHQVSLMNQHRSS